MEEERKEYQEMLVKFFDGDISDDEIEELKSLLEESAEYRRIFDKKNQLWQESGIQTKLEYYKADEGWEKISSRPGIVGSGNKSVIVINKLRLRLMLAAALVACMVAIGSVALWLSGKQTPVETIIASTTISTEEGDKAYIYLPDSTNTGYYLRKGLDQKYAINGRHRKSSASYIIFRYAEVLLSYAEAQNEAAGPDLSVYDAVNLVRTRSELPALPDGLDQSQMREAIRHERRVELAFELRRWYDLIRWKIAEININRTKHAMLIKMENNVWVYEVINAPNGNCVFDPNKHYVWPIPRSAMDKNPNLVQNPNY